MTTKVPYKETGYFSSLITDYIDGKKELKEFYLNPFTPDGFKKQIAEKEFSEENRKVLYEVLTNQYSEVKISDKTSANICSLQQQNTFTVTTGHQLNLFTGPLYFLYKIISVIALTEQFKKTFPENNFIPVYWMASEDHDIAEVNHFNLFGKKYELPTRKKGAVGNIQLEGISTVFEELKQDLKDRNGVETIISKLEQFYVESSTYAEATKGFVNHLFGKYGLVIIEGNSKKLKQLFSPIMANELVERTNVELINATSNKLSELGYKKQVNPRELNLFYLDEDVRERIVFEEGKYSVLNTNIVFTKEEILKEVDEHPNRFSPNVVLRPLFQEIVLPNLAYIGGVGELAYWFQLKEMFDAHKVSFPILGLRNSVMIVDGGSKKKIEKLGLESNELFLDSDEMIKKYLNENASENIDFDKVYKGINSVFEKLSGEVNEIDQSVVGMVKAEEQKALKSIKNIEGKVLKSIKQKNEVSLNQLRSIKEKLFPNNNLQEREENIIYVYLLLGDQFIDGLVEELNPLGQKFTIVS